MVTPDKLLSRMDLRAILLACGIFACVLVIVASAPRPDYFAILEVLLHRSWHLICLALGIGLVIALADIDLSAPGLISLATVLLLTLESSGVPPSIALAIVLAVPTLLGLVHGLAVTRFGVQPLVLTLGSSFACLGIATLLSLDLQSRTLPATHVLSAYIPSAFVAIGVLLLASVWRYCSLDAIRHCAVGMSRESARRAGLPVARLRLRAFLVSGLCAGLTALLLSSYLRGGVGHPRIGLEYELYAIAACVLGGTRVSGGRYAPVNIALAAILLRAVDHVPDGLDAVPPESHRLATGLLVVAAAIADHSLSHARKET